MAKKKINKEITKIIQKIIDVDFAEEMKESYLDYSLEVISDRAIPNIKDGLKPVQRRSIYATIELGVTFDKPHKKSARIVGDTMGKICRS